MKLSFVKNINVVAKKWPEIVAKWPFMSHRLSGFFLTKLEQMETKKICDLCHSF